MSERNETLADVVAEMRGRVEPGVWIPWGEIGRLADRIEAAALRERNHFRDVTKMVGNAAALREALELARDAVLYAVAARAFPERLVAVIDAALAAPPSNCDRFANIPGDAICAWLKEDPATRYMTNEEQNAAAVFARWLFDVATQEGGK